MKTVPLILASNSPRRRELLQQTGLAFQVRSSTVREDFTLDLPPAEFARYYARLKAADVARDFPGHLVVAADTIVVLDGTIMGKPAGPDDSFRMLTALSGKTHTVITGVTLLWKSRDREDTFHEETQVTFKHLSEADIRYYIETYQPLDKAGSYGIQDWFATCIRRVEGCFYNVVGFPIAAFYEHYRSMLKSMGAL